MFINYFNNVFSQSISSEVLAFELFESPTVVKSLLDS